MEETEAIQVVYRDTAELVPYAKNSREHSADQIRGIANSIKQFGFLNPVIVDGDKGLIAGHARVMAAKHLKMKKIPTIEAAHLTEDQKRAYIIADNKLASNSSWNEKILTAELMHLKHAEFDLLVTGFDQDELNKLLGETTAEEEEVPEIVFSEELGEAHNYVVIYFDNELDWISAKTHFDLKSVYSKRTTGQAWSKGIGRVINGAEYLHKIKGDR